MCKKKNEKKHAQDRKKHQKFQPAEANCSMLTNRYENPVVWHAVAVANHGWSGSLMEQYMGFKSC
jgi:hypothetical protein